MPKTSSAELHFNDIGTLGFYWRMVFKPYPKETVTILLFIVGSAVLDAVTIGLAVPLLDGLTAPERAQQSSFVSGAAASLNVLRLPATRNVVIFALMVVASLLFMLRSVFFLLDQYYTAAIAVKLRRRLKTALFGKFLQARYENLSTRARGTIINDINQPAESLAGAITQLGFFLTGIFNSVLMIVLLVYLSWWATLLIGVLAVGGVQGWRMYADRRAAIHGRTLYGLRGEQHKLQVDAIDGVKVVKAHGLESRMVSQHDALLAGELRPELQLVFFKNGPTLVNELIAVVIVVGLGAITFLLPSFGLRFSMLATFLLAIRRIAPSLSTINRSSVELNKYKRNLEVIDEVLEMLSQERRGGRGLARVEELRLANVSFSYASRPQREVLKGVAVTMRRGTVTAIVGPTGSGKSTIANLLLGLYEPVVGSVMVNGRDARDIDLCAWRTHVGYVSQDVFVFNATVRENIALGGDDIPMSRVEWAARVAQVHEFIASLPEGYDTVVGDRGLRLSGGQCQRLAIARAILKKPDVLIFDEATSALDNLTERAVYEAINTLHADAIVIVIAHRLSTVRDADQILVLQLGAIVETGTHAGLMGRRGAYAKLYEQDRELSVSHAESVEGMGAVREPNRSVQSPLVR